MIQIFPDKLVVLASHGAEMSIPWSEVYRVHAYRLDLMTSTSCFVCFDYEYGESLEVSDTMEGFAAMLTALGSHLPLPSDYQEQVAATRCDTEPITLYERPA